MNTNAHESLDDVVKGVIGAAYEVSNVLGAGFLEKVYQRALIRELVLRGLTAKSQVFVSRSITKGSAWISFPMSTWLNASTT